MSGIQLRPYQGEAADAVGAAWGRGMRAPAVVLPTGAGKTVVFSFLARVWLKLNPGRRVLVLAHRTELIDQAYEKIHDVAPDLRVGIVMGTRNETRADVIVGSVQTLAGEARRLMILDVGLIVVDECHHAVAASYRAVLAHWPDAVHVGFTATMSRSDDLNLGDVWEDVVYIRSIGEMIRDGFLVRPRGMRVYVESLDMSGLRKSGGDYRDGDIGKAIEGSLAPEAIAAAIMEHSSTGQTVVFAPTVASAELIRDAIREAGTTAEMVHGAQKKDERRRHLATFRAGALHVLVNCMVLTEGTDLPMIVTVVIARPTAHAGLYIQMVGRGLRLFPGKDFCLVMDVVGASQRHGLDSFVELFGEQTPDAKKASEAEVIEEMEHEFDDFDDPGSGGGGFDEEWVHGPTKHVEVDLFHGSKSAWMRTYAGVWFLAAGERYITILPGLVAGTYDVMAMHSRHRGQARWVATGVTDISWAMAWGEGDVGRGEGLTVERGRSWRKKRVTDAQWAKVRRLGLGSLVTEGMTSGEISRLIAERVASARIDPVMSAHVAARPVMV